jgi:hypothetical protein
MDKKGADLFFEKIGIIIHNPVLHILLDPNSQDSLG